MSFARICRLAPLVLAAAAPLIGAESHPTRANRLVENIDGIQIEYSPGQEAYLRPIAERIVAWNHELDERAAMAALAAKSPLPLSARDLRENRAAILKQIAAAIGLDAPTPLQGRCYDTMLAPYEDFDGLVAYMTAFYTKAMHTHSIMIWDREELVRRLSSGESIPGYTYDPKTNEGNFSFKSTEKLDAAQEEQKELQRQAEQQQLDHTFNYKVDDNGVAHIAASFSFNLKNPAPAIPAGAERGSLADSDDKIRSLIEAQPEVTFPVVLSKNAAGQTPDEVAENFVKDLRKMFEGIAARLVGYRNASLASVVFHETTEAGIVEHYIGSADRRWICDGTANYVAWRVARDRAGAEFARQVYDLNAQLAQYAALQPNIDLLKWPAVERQREEDRETPLTLAHYAFATRALFLLVQAKGEDAVPRLFREIGRTPREKVSMKTVAKAYRTITGAKLDELLRAAEKTPIMPVPPAK